MMKRIYIYLFGAVLLAFVSSCSSTKSMKKSVSIGNLSETEYMTEVLNRAPAWDALTAKMSMAVDLNGKGATKISGTIRMKRDEVIQLYSSVYRHRSGARRNLSRWDIGDGPPEQALRAGIVCRA